MIRDHRCSLCWLIAVLRDVFRGSRVCPWRFVGNMLKTLRASDWAHGGCLSSFWCPRAAQGRLGGFGELVDVLTGSMTNQEGRNTTNHCILLCLEASLSAKLKFWRARNHDLQHSSPLSLPRRLRVSLADVRPSESLGVWGAPLQRFKAS